ncbi:MAG: PD40 domain-containing protein [Sporichthya sp.]|nr:PD40 domain-containing protein [Sporichthya sp.]
MGADGANPTKVPGGQAGLDPVFSPDGTWIAFLSDRDGTYRLYVARMDGTRTLALSDHADNDTELEWGPQP